MAPTPRVREGIVTRLEGVSACVFDAYGTLFDFASATQRCEEAPADKRAALTALWRDKQLQYTWLRALQNRYADFWQVTGDALDFRSRKPRPRGHGLTRAPDGSLPRPRAVPRSSRGLADAARARVQDRNPLERLPGDASDAGSARRACRSFRRGSFGRR